MKRLLSILFLLLIKASVFGQAAIMDEIAEEETESLTLTDMIPGFIVIGILFYLHKCCKVLQRSSMSYYIKTKRIVKKAQIHNRSAIFQGVEV